MADGGFGQCDGQAAFCTIVGALDHAGVNERAEDEMQVFFLLQITSWRRAGFQGVFDLQISRTTEPLQWIALIHWAAEQNNRIAFILEPLSSDMLRALDEPDHGH